MTWYNTVERMITLANKTAKGIDVSVHNGNIDFQKVKAAGYDFVILRAGYGREITQKDSTFEKNYKNAKAAGLQVGAYWYSYATFRGTSTRIFK